MARLVLPAGDRMTREQRQVCDEVIAGRRGKVPSPMIAWLQSPEFARRAQLLGEQLRFGTTLDTSLVELATLVCARHWTAHQVWTSHRKHGLAAGLSEDVVDAVAARRPPTLADARQRVVYETATALLHSHRLSDAQYAVAVEVLGEAGVVELVGVVGYYCLVSLTANAFELGLPENAAPELGDPAAR